MLGFGGMNEKMSDGKMGLVVERVYIYMYVIDIFNIGVIFESFELFFKFFCNVIYLNIDCKFKRILGFYLL